MPESPELPGRIESEIIFAERWATRQGYWYHSLTAFKIFAAASIPVILTISKPGGLGRTWAGILGGLVAVAEAFRSNFELENRWAHKRLECEALKSEKFLYLGRAGVYAKADNPDALLVERTEMLIAERISSTFKGGHRRTHNPN